jgi:hypothetical protein
MASSNLAIQHRYKLRCVGKILALTNFSLGCVKMCVDVSNETQRQRSRPDLSLQFIIKLCQLFSGRDTYL